ncbi:probable LRR receptor-like serine/threonine-protein kinase At3g47570 [Triticum dicoccoides]|uniref:probable LRR receptor-like serine/threonine-protein kinase At3g47570 n=1 Tax=Triticum dicoccoides TaxID=85692 RepID=UPI001891BD97|nr:probable LRR receptor-like serine/threonine-protein kinase At3g47570 [Triticum dicoccoides]
MATMARPLEMLLLLLLAVHVAAASNIHTPERDALRAFRAGVSDPEGKLQSWNSTAHFCRWAGVNCMHGHVTALRMMSFGLTGTISPALGNLTYLERLDLNRNALSGGIPASLGQLRHLNYLGLCDNGGVSGEIPDSLCNCTSLATAYLNNNTLTGTIPAWLGTLPNLTTLWLNQNLLTGEIPPSFGNLTKLDSLWLHQNFLEGTLPEGLSRLALLRDLNVYQNHLGGDIPPRFFNMSSLEDMSLANNEFTGSLPSYAGARMTKLQVLLLGGNNLTGPIPASLANATAMVSLSLSNNSFNGQVPPEIGTLCLSKLEMSNNELTATNEYGGWEFLDSLTKCNSLEILSLDNNKFSGTMPRSIGNLSRKLLDLNLGGNRISGSIPSGMENLIALQTLGLESNLLTGTIPEGIGKLKNLTELRLQENKLSGPVPSSIGSLTELLRLVLSNNELSGSIPLTLGNLQKVALLNLSSNALTGEVPRQLFNLPSLSQAMDLSNNRLDGSLPPDVIRLGNLALLKLSGNRLTGEIPKQLGSCQSLEFLGLDNNFFSGSIPPSLSKLKGLQMLNLTSNKLSGRIPAELGGMSGLQELYLSWNNLTGTVPEEMANMSSLIKLDVSYNHLEGHVPLRGVFANMTGFNFTENGELCGGVPQLHLPQCPVVRYGSHTNWPLHIMAPILGIVLISAILLTIFLCYKRNSRHTKATTPEILDASNYQRVSYAELAKATNGFADANLIGAGKFGSVYLGVLPLDDNGTPESVPVAVKVFDLQQVGASKTFLSECEALRSIRHRNLIRNITCCSSIDGRGDDFKALVFELMPNYSLDRWLHPTPEALKNVGSLTAIQRLNIAVDIADALHYLHSNCVPPIIHCDLKPSNVLLSEDMTACIGDFGLAKLLLDPGIHDTMNSESTIGIRGTIGYVAPEYGTTGKVSTHGDVYSFGITLLEIFSGRSPTDDIFRDGLTLPGFVGAAFSNRTEEVLDATLLATKEFDGDSGVSVHDCLVSAIRVGLSCTRAARYERMSMRDAAAELRAIRDACVRA